MAGPFLIQCTTAPLKCPADEKLYVKHVILKKGDQNPRIQRKEVKNCLMINQLLSDGGKQGKQILWKKLLMVEFSSYSEDEVSGILARNIEYNGSRYCFLGFSELQLKNKTCFLIAETEKQIGERRTKFGNFSDAIPFADRVAKLQHIFEPFERSLQLAQDEFEFINNGENTEKSGLMSPELAGEIKKTVECSLPNDPSVAQVICPGFSGKLVLCHEMGAKVESAEKKSTIKAQFNTSKAANNCGRFDSSPVVLNDARQGNANEGGGSSLTMGIVDYSKPYKMGYLDVYTVMFLKERGVASDYLLELQRHYYDDVLKKLETDLTSAKYFLRLSGREDILRKVENGITPDARETIVKIRSDETRKMRENKDDMKLRILVSKSREVFGIVDPYKNQLQSNECVFAPCLDCLEPQDQELFGFAEEVLIIPEPCYSATDIRVLKLVRDKEEYNQLRDCIVLPSQTETQAVSNKYFVSWDRNLLHHPNSTIWNSLSEFRSQILRVADLPGTISSVLPFSSCRRSEAMSDRVSESVTSQVDKPSTSGELHKIVSFQKELKNYFANFKSSDDLIITAKSLFKKIALLNGSPSCSECKQLGEYLSPSFDWIAKRDETEKYLTKLDRKYKKLSSDEERNQESAAQSSSLQALCKEITANLKALAN